MRYETRIPMREDELYHYGRKGMKWGQHIFGKARDAISAKRKLAKERKSEASERKKRVKADEASKKRKPSSMSDAELKQRIERLELEKRYRELLADSKSKKTSSKGKKLMDEMLERSVKNIGTQAATYALGEIVNMAIEKSTGKKNAVNPKKGQKDK